MMNISHHWSLVSGCFLLGCVHTHDVAEQADYQPSIFEYRRGRADLALQRFPKEEKGGFITSLERSWLALIDGRPDDEKIMSFGKDLEKLQSLDVSDELVSTFYKENIDRYYPAEHEAVILHLITAMIFLKKDQQEAAKVELRRGARYLQSGYGKNRTVTDSASLRIWLAALWYAAGDYEAAHIDLRAAMRLAPDKDWIGQLIIPQGQPVQLHLVFSGIGPSLVWKPLGGESANPIANLQFLPSRQGGALDLQSLKGTIHLSHFLVTEDWYTRHQTKNQQLAYVLRGANYAGKAAVIAGASSLNTIGAVSLGVLVASGGIAGGALLAFQVGGEVGASLGLGMAYTGWSAASNLIDSANRKSSEFLETGLGETETYRFVRFLPDVIHVYRGELEVRDDSTKTFLRLGNSHNAVTFSYHPDVSGSAIEEKTVGRHFYHDGKVWRFRTEIASLETAVRACEEMEWQGEKGHLPQLSQLRSALEAAHSPEGLYPKQTLAELGQFKAFWIEGPKIWSPSAYEGDQATLLCYFNAKPPHPVQSGQ